MPSYNTNLKTWGSTGQEYPDSYNYVEGEQPVDAWDNFLTSNLITDIDHLIDVTNNELIARDGTVSMNADLPLGGNNINGVQDINDNNGNTVYDYSNSWIPQERVEQGPGSGLDADTVDGDEASDLKGLDASQSVVTGSRSFGTWYQNTTGNALFISVSLAGANNTATIEAYSDTTQTQTRVAWDQGSEATGNNEGASVSFIVPNGNYYRADDLSANSAGMREWVEWELF